MKCPACGAAELIHDTRDVPYTYKGETIDIPSVTGDFCPACGEVVLDRIHGDRLSEAMGLFQRQVNAAYVDPAYITQVRKNSPSTNAKPPNFSAAASMPFRVTKRGKPGRRWLW